MTHETFGAVARASAKPCRICDGPPDYQLSVESETHYACARDAAGVESTMESRSPTRKGKVVYRLVRD